MSVELPQIDFHRDSIKNIFTSPGDKKPGILPDKDAPPEGLKEEIWNNIKRPAEGLPDHGTWEELNVDGSFLDDPTTHD